MKESIEFARIVAFTDGVFAIAITVLVLGLDVPPELPGSELHEFLVDSWPQLFAYFLSFAVLGRFWLAHHRIFAMLQDFDRGLIVLNLTYLSLVVLIPFPTELLGDYGSEADPVVLYAAVTGSVALMSCLTLRYALSHGHVHPDERVAARRMAAGALRPAIVFYVSIPIALLSPALGQLFWLVLLFEVFRRDR